MKTKAKISRKAMEVNPMSIIIGAVILIFILFIFFYGIFPIFTGKQIPWLKATVDETTKDCDGDGLIGLNDPCPCSRGLKTDESNACPEPDGTAQTNCPDGCKS